MASPKDEMKKQIEKNTVLLTQEDATKRQSKLVVRFSPPKPSVSVPAPLSLYGEPIFDFESEEEEDENHLTSTPVGSPPTPHPIKPIKPK